MRNVLFATVVLLWGCSVPEPPPPSPLGPLPSQAQLQWHQMEMNAFVHFTINTFTDKEWGYGDESESLFNPTEINVDQWVSTFKDTGFSGVILTCKHHDGFCLWPSAYTTHSVKQSPYKNGQGDIVREVADACARHGLKFGIYVSPWDRNHADYGDTTYITYYRNQLKELFTNYGPMFEMWFDGANGGDGFYGGKNERRRINGATYYDWPTTLDEVRTMEPNIIFFSDAGPGVRWVGNERGLAGETNWNMITPDTLYAGKAGIEQLLQNGSEEGTKWIPAEVDVSIRPGWFYHASEDTLVKSPKELFDLYLTSVGRGSTLLLNIPPDRRGVIHENDVASLKGFRELLNKTFSKNLAEGARVEVTESRGKGAAYTAHNLIDQNDSTYWATNDGVTKATITITPATESVINFLVLKEPIHLGQRIKAFRVEQNLNGTWTEAASGTTVGYKRIMALDSVKGQVRIVIEDARACPIISEIELY